jgi:catechol 2,3-dioxygenase-like lactoylglutathione lyase family enzyme
VLPTRHYLEVLAFPPGKGQSKWHEPKGKLFLGIDHTAIVVSDTAASLHFYRDVLGLRVVGTSENYGTEQEHLNNVFGARLRITSLRADQGPGVEFLEYLAPRTGRASPVDTQADDLWYWQINMRAASPAGVETAGELADFLYASLRYYRRISAGRGAPITDLRRRTKTGYQRSSRRPANAVTPVTIVIAMVYQVATKSGLSSGHVSA